MECLGARRDTKELEKQKIAAKVGHKKKIGITWQLRGKSLKKHARRSQ